MIMHIIFQLLLVTTCDTLQEEVSNENMKKYCLVCEINRLYFSSSKLLRGKIFINISVNVKLNRVGEWMKDNGLTSNHGVTI